MTEDASEIEMVTTFLGNWTKVDAGKEIETKPVLPS
jgi:hypothetical protein